MTTSRWRRWVGALALAAGVTVLAPAHAEAAPPCLRLAISPTFATDRTVACYTFRRLVTGEAEIFVYVSRDGMRTWRKATAAGFTATPDTYPDSMFFFGQTLFFQTSRYGLQFSDDLGETFQVADPLARSAGVGNNLAPVPALSPAVPGFPAVEIAMAGESSGAAMIRPPLHQQAVGSTDSEVTFAAYTDPAGNRRWLGLAFRQPGAPIPNPGITSVWDCDAALTCTEKRHEFTTANPYDMVAAPDFGRSGVVFVKNGSPVDNFDRLWRSADGGRNFTEVGPVVAFRKDLLARKITSGFTTDVAFLGGHHVLLTMEYVDDTSGSPSLPVRQMFVSTDLGATWRLVAYGRSPYQKGPRGTLTLPGLAGRPEVVAGRWFAMGWVNENTRRPYCSRDAGRTWKTYCD